MTQKSETTGDIVKTISEQKQTHTTSPDEWEAIEGDRADECLHEEAEVNWEGRLMCSCGHSEWLSEERLKAILKIQANAEDAYHKEMEEAVKQEMEKGMPETTPVRISDDELPF